MPAYPFGDALRRAGTSARTLIALHVSQRAPAQSSPHETRLNAVLRPVVFGGSDGLVSNLALVVGVAAAAADEGVIVLAGIAGLLAGAFSMGVGEYVSVRSQRELLDYQRQFQRAQLRDTPGQERQILTDIYLERGLTEDEARLFVDRVFADPELAVRTLLHEEVGLDERSIGSPWSAALGSFAAFTLGACIPVVPYLMLHGAAAFAASVGLSLLGLFLLGVGVSRLTHRSALYSGGRQLALGGLAAAVTYLVGAAIGTGRAGG